METMLGSDGAHPGFPSLGLPGPGAGFSRLRGARGVLLSLVVAVLAAGAEPSTWWGSLGIRDLQGAPLSPGARWFVVVFMGQECPVSNASIPTLNRLSAEFQAKGFEFVGAYVDPTAELSELRSHVADYGVAFPTADDRRHTLVKLAGVTYTPEVAVFSASGTRLYRGRIDDRVGRNGEARPLASTHGDLHDVLLAIASGSAGPFQGETGFGCAIPEAPQK